jgi:hypothetical protein
LDVKRRKHASQGHAVSFEANTGEDTVPKACGELPGILQSQQAVSTSGRIGSGRLASTIVAHPSGVEQLQNPACTFDLRMCAVVCGILFCMVACE